MRRLWVFLLAFGILFSGCRKRSSSGTKSHHSEGTGAFAREQPPGSPSLLGIKKSTFGKDLLMRSHSLSDSPRARFRYLKTRIVQFVFKDGHVLLQEVGESPATLAVFSPLYESEAYVYLDFNHGMKKLYTMPDTYYETEKENFSSQAIRLHSVQLKTSFLSKIDASQEHEVNLSQNAQLILDEGLMPVEIHYQFSLYRINQGFQATDDPLALSLALSDELHAAKFDSRKPIVFYISANTPEKFIQSIKDGVLYWNKVFGRPLLEVKPSSKTLPLGATQVNMIQWVDWDATDTVYADEQRDPRSGEILNAQVFLPGKFLNEWDVDSITSLIDTKEDLFNLNQYKEFDIEKFLFEVAAGRLSKHEFFEKAQHGLLTKAQQVSEKQKIFKPICSMSLEKSVLKDLMTLRGKGVDNETYWKLGLNALRWVVAHQIGHTLGLKHNFASGLEIDRDFSQIENTEEQLIKNPEKNLDINVTNSVMGYYRLYDAALVGMQIRDKQRDAFDFDKKATEFLYGQKKISLKELPAFCNETHIQTYADCQHFMVGKNPFAFTRWKLETSFERTSEVLASYILNGLKKGVSPHIFKETLQQRAKALALETSFLQNNALRAIKKNARSLYTERYLRDDLLTTQDISDLYAEGMSSFLIESGGWDKILIPLTAIKIKKMTERTMAVLLASNLSLDKTQSEWVRQSVDLFMDVFSKTYEQASLLLLLQVEDLLEALVNKKGQNESDFGTFLLARARNFLFESDGSLKVLGSLSYVRKVPLVVKERYWPEGVAKFDIPSPINGRIKDAEDFFNKEIESLIEAEVLDRTLVSPLDIRFNLQFDLSKYRYSSAVRSLAILLLSEQRSQAIEFDYKEKESVARDFKEMLSRDLQGLSMEQIGPGAQPKAFARWLVENKQVLKVLQSVESESFCQFPRG